MVITVGVILQLVFLYVFYNAVKVFFERLQEWLTRNKFDEGTTFWHWKK